MKITKLGHCCLYIEIDGVRILTDPGSFSESQNTISPVDIILITHEHADHMHIESVKMVLANNSEAVIYTNQAVAALLMIADIPCKILQGRDQVEEKGIRLSAFDCRHEEIYEDLGQVQNTGYLIADRLFYPGDSFHEPNQPVDILALPVAGPWCKIGDAITYALKVKPRVAFPVHDGMIIPERMSIFHNTAKRVLEKNGITFVALTSGEDAEF